MLEREPPGDRGAVVLDVNRVAVQAELVEQAGGEVGEGGEGVVELVRAGGGGVAEAEVVGRDDAVAIGQQRDEFRNMKELVGYPCSRTIAGAPAGPASR